MEDPDLSSEAREQARLWDAAARDWAELVAVVGAPAWSADLDAARVTRGRRVVDLGCGSGEALVLADLRGAETAGVDVSERLLEIARSRLPDADLRRAGLDALPFEDGLFDAAIAANTVTFADEPADALREAYRVLRPGGRLAVSVWGRDECVDYVAIVGAMYELAGRPEPERYFPLGREGGLEELLREAGFDVVEAGDVAVPFVWVDEATLLAAQSANAGAQRLLGVVDRRSFDDAILDAAAPFRRADGSYRFENQYRYVAGRRPGA